MRLEHEQNNYYFHSHDYNQPLLQLLLLLLLRLLLLQLLLLLLLMRSLLDFVLLDCDTRFFSLKVAQPGCMFFACWF